MPFSYMSDVAENLSVYQLTNDVLRAAYADPVLAVPEICPIITVDRLHVRQPTLGRLRVNTEVREYESIGTQTPNATSKDIELLNDRIAVQVSAEAQIENYYGDSIAMFAAEQGKALGMALEMQIMKALKDNPLKILADPAWTEIPDDYAADQHISDKIEHNLFKATTAWHHHVVRHGIQLLGVYKPTAVVVNPATWADLQPLFSGAIQPKGGFGMPYAWNEGPIPGFDCPVAKSLYCPVDKMYLVSAHADAVRCYQYDTIRPVLQYDPVINADSMYAGIWRRVVSGFRLATKSTWSKLGAVQVPTQTGNAGVVEITLGKAFWGGIDMGDVPWENYIAQANALIQREINDTAVDQIERQKLVMEKTGNRVDHDALAEYRRDLGLPDPIQPSSGIEISTGSGAGKKAQA